MDYLNKEQAKALKQKQKTSAIYERTNTVIDTLTGEVISEEKQLLKKTSTEPDFIKLYYSTMLAFNGVSDVPLELIMIISSFISWANDGEQMVFRNDKYTKETISKKLNIKESMVTKYIKRCCDAGLLIPKEGYRGYYYVNPFFIAKGKWDNIKVLQSSFNYINGKWECVVGSEQPTNEPPQYEKAV